MPAKDGKNIVTSNKDKDKDLSKVEEVKDTPSALNEVIANARKKAKESGKVKRVDYLAKSTGTRPLNVYKENTDQGVFIWWTTEDSKTVGKETIALVNEMTLEREEKGYELTIPFDEEVAKEVHKLGGSFSKFYAKDGERTEGLKTFEAFLTHTF